jgi:membrane-bound lytic murein transglycosylase B
MTTLSRISVCLVLCALAFCTTAFAVPSLAAPQSIEDCEKIEAADAYNNCLASFGPEAREHKLSPNVPEGAGNRVHVYGRHHHRVHSAEIERGGGRQRMDFSVTPRHRH